LPDCPFEVWRTTRYTSQPEAAIRARVAIEKGSEITYLSGTQARFDNEAPDNNDFSITESNRHGSIFRKLGPSRFVNHGCEPNAILGFSNSYNEVKVRALKKIWAGDEITISYGKNPFGEDNRDCHCQTCKPQPKNAQSIFSPIQLRSLREEIPLDDFKLVLLQNMHRDLYGLAWPNRE
jgi:histone-lysine N-methyltransferase SUV420H